MKMLVLLAPLLLVGCETNDKIKRGDWELEGTTSLARRENDFSDLNAAELDVLLNTAITSGFQLGPVLVFEASDQDSRGGEDIDSIAYLFGPNFRFNLPGKESLVPFVDAAVGTYYLDADVRLGDGTRFKGDDSGLFFQGGVGCRFFVSERAAISLALRYRHIDISSDLGGSEDLYGFFGGLSVLF
ncbi:MAG: hypothetical protein U1E76_28115 [Planctomycetota bacterium]